jgi:hypothetical protein
LDQRQTKSKERSEQSEEIEASDFVFVRRTGLIGMFFFNCSPAPAGVHVIKIKQYEATIHFVGDER